MTISRRAVTGWLYAGLTIGLLLAAVGIIDGRAVVEKILQRLVTPVGLLWLGLAFQFSGSLRSGHRWHAVSAGALWIALTLMGNGPLVGQLFSRDEHPYVAVTPLQAVPYDVVIVLGGGASTGANGRPQVNSAGDRIVLAAQLYHAGKARRLICTGQRIKALVGDAPDPSEQAISILEALGVPAAAIEQSGGSNTSEELAQIAKLLKPGERVGLLTSAWHMARAQRLADRHGLSLEPVPADFEGPAQGTGLFAGFGAAVLAVIPDAEALLGAARWEKEKLAELVGR